MEYQGLLGFIQAVGVPAAFSFVLLWIVDRRLASLAEKIDRVLTIMERTGQDMATIAASLNKER